MSNSHNYADFKYSFSGSDCNVHAFYPNQTKLRKALESRIKKFKEYAKKIQESSTYQKALKEETAMKAHKAKLDKAQAKNMEMEAIDSPDPRIPTIDIQKAMADQKDRMIKDGVWGYKQNIDNEVRRIERAISDVNSLLGKYGAGDGAHLESLATISLSVHEPKGLVRRMGNRNIVGYTRSTRTIAGTMIFTVVDKHPLSQLMALDPQNVDMKGQANDGIEFKWHFDQDLGTGSYDNVGTGVKKWLRTPTDLSPFNLLFEYQSEYIGGPGASIGAAASKGRQDRAAEISSRLQKLKQMNDALVKELKELKKKLSKKKPKAVKDNVMIFPATHTEEQAKAQEAMQAKQKAIKKEFDELQKVYNKIVKGNKTHQNQSKSQNRKATLILENIEFISMGMVTSVNDMVSEISLQFVAGNIYELSGPNLDPLLEFPELVRILSSLSYIGDESDNFDKVINGVRAGMHPMRGAFDGASVLGMSGCVIDAPPDMPPLATKLQAFMPPDIQTEDRQETGPTPKVPPGGSN